VALPLKKIDYFNHKLTDGHNSFSSLLSSGRSDGLLPL
jgi:hypothetical protein